LKGLENSCTLKFLSGHDALSNLVDVAVAQPSLPVPNESNSRRSHISVSAAESQSQSHPQARDRFPAYLHHAEMAALQHQQQQQHVNFQQQKIVVYCETN
jgi:hypothetical protein